MSSSLPDRVEIARQVQARRIYDGELPLASMRRLCGSLASTEGVARYNVEFGKDRFGISFIALRVEAELPLTCQRTLDIFEYPVSIDQRLGVIAAESEESGLPEGYEPLLAPEGDLSIAEVIEDELILALPVVPLKPGEPLEWNDPLSDDEVEEPKPNPFAVLGQLKKH
ncbi:MAG: YceD family protein [Dokdonella sp.]|uniref:YceD family protein n=1 Tax=Dokdonella sp. TaxID=2291710 RepID=UPI0032634D50